MNNWKFTAVDDTEVLFGNCADCDNDFATQ